MATSVDLWLVVADSEHARLLHGTPSGSGALHLDEIGHVRSTFVAGEHRRPTRMGQPGRSAPLGHEQERKVAWFASELLGWLGPELDHRGVDAVHVLAPAHLLGALRQEAPSAMAERLHEHAGEFTGFTLGELARHARVQALFRGGPKAAKA